jgi:hypothetical protein
MRPDRRRAARTALAALCLAGAAEASAATADAAPGSAPSPRPTPSATPAASPTPGPAASPEASQTPAPGTGSPRSRPSRHPCEERSAGEKGALDLARRGLYETLCSAALWLDGLFGERGSVAAARGASGSLEISGLGSKFEGLKMRTNLDVDVTLPHVEQRLHAFVGRAISQDFVRSRSEGFALRSQFVGLDERENWLAGLGYSLPGSTLQRTSFRLGATGGRQPTVFVQGLFEHNTLVGDRDLWTFRAIPYWRSREGFGATTSLDYDHAVGPTMLLRWGNVGTVSQAFSGLDWRSALVLYRDLRRSRAMAYEVFLRGKSATGVTVGEYGGRVVYRQSIFRPWFFVETLLGYSWLRQTAADRRSGSVTVGLGAELLFGRGP